MNKRELKKYLESLRQKTHEGIHKTISQTQDSNWKDLNRIAVEVRKELAKCFKEWCRTRGIVPVGDWGILGKIGTSLCPFEDYRLRRQKTSLRTQVDAATRARRVEIKRQLALYDDAHDRLVRDIMLGGQNEVDLRRRVMELEKLSRDLSAKEG